jgi:Rad3-related DNA helicase
VLGGIFGEGIDLQGDRLSGCAIISVGLPQINVEQDIIRDYFDGQNGQGFEYAYMYPGMNKVLQAAGRVIRSETDTGTVVLIDARFTTPRYTKLFPRHWRHYRRVGSMEAFLRRL